MLPDRKISLTKRTEERLKRIKQLTKQNINQLANEMFFSSMENAHKFQLGKLPKIEMGEIKLDKATWLGECQTAAEILLRDLYPTATKEELAILWALHIDSVVE